MATDALSPLPERRTRNVAVILFLVAALILFIIAALNIATRINLTAAGLACVVASMLVPLL